MYGRILFSEAILTGQSSAWTESSNVMMTLEVCSRAAETITHMPKFLRHSNIRFKDVQALEYTDIIRQTTAGIDCHKNSYHVYFLHHDTTKSLVSERYCKFGVGADSVNDIRLFLAACQQEIDHQIELVILESTGPYSRPLFFALAETWALCMVNPSEFHKYGSKTDKFDAKKLALLAMQGIFQPSFLETPQEVDCKQIARAALKHRQHASSMSNSLGAFLIQNDIGFMRGQANVKVGSKSGQQMLEAIIAGETSPVLVAQAASYYVSEDETKRTRMVAIENSLYGVQTLSHHARSVIADKCRIMQNSQTLYQKQLAAAREAVSQLEHDGLTGARAIELLDTIPSLSELAAVLLLSEIGLRIRERFGEHQAGVDKFVSYVGLNPSRQYSGDKQTSTRKAVRGNTFTRSLLIECGQSLLKSPHQMGERYRALMRRSGGSGSAAGYRIAVAAAAKGLAKACFWVLTKREPFNDSQYDYTRAIRSKERQLQKLVSQFRQLEDELNTEQHGGSTVLHKALAGLAKQAFVLTSANVPNDLTMFEKRLQTVLASNGMTTVRDVWFYLSNNRLGELKGIGDKTQQKIIETLIQEQIIEKVTL